MVFIVYYLIIILSLPLRKRRFAISIPLDLPLIMILVSWCNNVVVVTRALTNHDMQADQFYDAYGDIRRMIHLWWWYKFVARSLCMMEIRKCPHVWSKYCHALYVFWFGCNWEHHDVIGPASLWMSVILPFQLFRLKSLELPIKHSNNTISHPIMIIIDCKVIISNYKHHIIYTCCIMLWH